jgi:hypothetical protein
MRGRSTISASSDHKPLLARLGSQMNGNDRSKENRKRLQIGKIAISLWIASLSLVCLIALWRFGVVKEMKTLPDIVYCEIYRYSCVLPS